MRYLVAIVLLWVLPTAIWARGEPTSFGPGGFGQVQIGAGCRPLNGLTSGNRYGGYYTVESSLGWVSCPITAFKQTSDAFWQQRVVRVFYSTPGADSTFAVEAEAAYGAQNEEYPPIAEFGCVLDDRLPRLTTALGTQRVDEFSYNVSDPFDPGQQVLCLLPRDGAVYKVESYAFTYDGAATENDFDGGRTRYFGIEWGKYGTELLGASCSPLDSRTAVSTIGGHMQVISEEGSVACPIAELSGRYDTTYATRLEVWYYLPEADPTTSPSEELALDPYGDLPAPIFEYGCFLSGRGPDDSVPPVGEDPRSRDRWLPAPGRELFNAYDLICHLPRGGFVSLIKVSSRA